MSVILCFPGPFLHARGSSQISSPPAATVHMPDPGVSSERYKVTDARKVKGTFCSSGDGDALNTLGASQCALLIICAPQILVDLAFS